MTDARLIRGAQIAAHGRHRKLRRNLWSVGSQTSPTLNYLVDLKSTPPTCECLDFQTRGGSPDFTCKHVYAIQVVRHQIAIPNGIMADANDKVRRTYRQDWPAYNAAQVHEREHVEHLLRALCGGIISLPQVGRGRRRLPLADVVFAMVAKVFGTMSSRRAATDIRECAEKGLLDRTPSYNSMNDYFQDERLTPLLRTLVSESASPLADIEHEFCVDSTGFSTGMYARWFDHKYGVEKRQEIWIKAHVIAGCATQVITDVIVTDGDAGDSPRFEELLEHTAGRFTVLRVMADKAYLSKANMLAAERIGAEPYIPFKIGTTGNGPEIWRRMWHMHQMDREKFMAIYHKRSNAESVFSMVKRKFGPSVRSKMFVSQTNEVLCKAICHNLCVLVMSMYEVGIDPKFWQG